MLCPPWMVEAISGFGVLGLLYYVSWTHLARWVCKGLLKERVIFVGSFGEISPEEKGIKKERLPSRSPDHEVSSWKDPVVGVKGTNRERGCVFTPRFVTDGVLAEISQL